MLNVAVVLLIGVYTDEIDDCGWLITAAPSLNNVDSFR